MTSRWPLDASSAKLDELGAAILGFSVVALPGFANGGYGSGSWAWFTLIASCATAARLVTSHRVTLARPELIVLLSLALLAGWMWISGLWSISGSEPTTEARRTVLYLAVLLTLLVCVTGPAIRSLLVGTLLGIVVVSLYALARDGITSDDDVVANEAARLAGTVGYSNALGALAAIGIVLALGLGSRAPTAAGGWPLRASCVVLAATLALTDSRGAWLCLGIGLALAFIVATRGYRRQLVTAVGYVLLPASVASAVVVHVSGPAVALVVVGMAVVASLLPLAISNERLLDGFAVGGLAIGALALVLQSPTLQLGLREHYWRVALDDAMSNPLHGSGAGSFRISWLIERPISMNARDAHSLYLETLGELGLIGLVFLAGLIVGPIVVGMRERARAYVVVALAGYFVFVTHAALDWDWEVPAVTTTALSCAAAVLVGSRSPSQRYLTSLERAASLAAAVGLIGVALAVLALGTSSA